MVKYIHLRVHKDAFSTYPEAKGGITFAYDITGNTINFTASKCNAKDHYNKKIGRAIAGGRLACGKGVESLIVDPNRTATETILNHFAQQFYAQNPEMV